MKKIAPIIYAGDTTLFSSHENVEQFQIITQLSQQMAYNYYLVLD